MKTLFRKRTAAGLLLIAAAAAAASLLSGFSYPCGDSEFYIIDNLLRERSCIIQRYLFGGGYTENELFTMLSGTETYPLLSDDCRSIADIRGSDADTVINLQTESLSCISRSHSYGIYRADVIWYMSGCGGRYTERASYRIRTDIVNGKYRLAEMEPITDTYGSDASDSAAA